MTRGDVENGMVEVTVETFFEELRDDPRDVMPTYQPLADGHCMISIWKSKRGELFGRSLGRDYVNSRAERWFVVKTDKPLRKHPSKMTPEQSEWEKKLSELTRATPGLKWGYIGNFERWGDDRQLHIWVDGLTEDRGLYPTNTRTLWSCTAIQLESKDFFRARAAIKHFKDGWEARSKHPAEADGT